MNSSKINVLFIRLISPFVINIIFQSNCKVPFRYSTLTKGNMEYNTKLTLNLSKA